MAMPMIDPRGDLKIPNIGPSRAYRPLDSTRDHRRSLPANYRSKPPARPHRRPCHDWIFSTASNFHVAIDRSSFKTYTEFKSYVLAVSDHRQITVKGVGTVELSLRTSPDSHDVHMITLENVLHVPSWVCNIFSDIYFPGKPFDHIWSDNGIQFMRKKDDGTLKDWGYTTDFFGLERLMVLGSKNARSPMMEDKEREVFSVNVVWPQSQVDRWNAFGDFE